MAKFEVFHTLDAKVNGRCHPVIIGSHCMDDPALLLPGIQGKKVCIVTNETLAPLFLSKVKAQLQDLQCDEIILPDGEAYKNETSLYSIYNHLYQNRHHRDSTLIALGGGVIGDITGFAAATFMRGIHYIQLPTTLLAQVDAAIGGKTGINFALLKNGIGSFYQPSRVIIDVATLTSLPTREKHAAFGEVLKYAFLHGDLLPELYQDIDSLVNDERKIAQLIATCCQMKLDLVQKDPYDHHERLLLNLGHTVAHALEAITNYQRWLHGEAVAIGLYVVALLSIQLGAMKEKTLQKLQGLWHLLQLPSRIPQDIDLAKLLQIMFQDKKIINQRLRCVLIRAPGDCFITEVSADQWMLTLQNAVEGERIRMTTV